jgi:hypothetical protein
MGEGSEGGGVLELIVKRKESFGSP